MDPLTAGLVISGAGAVAGAVGDYKAGKAAGKQMDRVNRKAEGMFQNGSSPYEAMIQQLIGGIGDPTQLAADSGNIDIQSIMAQMNPGNDALNQFLNSDPTRQMQSAAGGQYDASQAFKMLEGNDQMQIDRSVNATRAGYAGLGQRFGSAAQRGEGRTRSDFAAQISARNAGISQSSFENAANRRTSATGAGLGFQLEGAKALSGAGLNAAQISAGLATSNQQNRYQNSAFNLASQQQNWQQKLTSMQAGFGMNQATFANNRDLLAIMAGLNPGGGQGWQAAGQAGMDIGQLMMFLPFMQNANKPRTA